MSLDLTPKMIVKEAMTSPALSVHEEQDIVRVAKMMDDGNVGAVVVTEKDDQPLGIVTERDIVIRVVARGINPKGVKAKDVMTSPLRMVDPDMSLVDAMTLMNKLNIRRLGVTYKGKLAGIVTDKDILRIVPTIIEIIQERSNIMATESPSGPSLSGFCDRCGVYSSNMRSEGGEFLCEDCRADMEMEA